MTDDGWRHTAAGESQMNVRAAEEGEIDCLAKIWYDGWHDGHAQIVPVELGRLRTLESFAHRLRAALPNVRVVGALGAPVGFCIVRRDELYQLFVSSQSRGSGVAAALIADAEAQLSQSGVATAWLACAIRNERAARSSEMSSSKRVSATGKVLSPPASFGLCQEAAWTSNRTYLPLLRRSFA